MDADALIADYLGRLRAASWPLPPARREELAGEVAEHIEAALAEAGARDDATVRNVLDRLGSPEVIAAAEGAGEGPVASQTVAPNPQVAPGAPGAPVAMPSGARSWGAVEILAILFLTVGSVFLPFFGPLIGLLFTWGSRQWSGGEKAIATAIVVVLLGLPLLALIAMRLAF